ncbi:MAG: hypothetical protein J5736_01870, partial [Bacilli bacterium]|nr:hypothetical protein [Bacilli bacterium]
YQIRKSWKDYPSLRERDEFDFEESGDWHHAYFYEAENPKGLILLAHGYSSLSDGHEASLADYFLRDGWSILQIDLTASGKDDDDQVGGFHVGANDIAETIRYLGKESRFASYRDSFCLLGFSWGAYAVSAALSHSFDIVPKAVASFAGFNSPAEEMLAMAKEYVGGLADFVRPSFELSLSENFGQEAFLSAVSGFNHSPDCKVILVQGRDDKRVPVDSASIWHFADTIENPMRLIRYQDALLPRDHASVFYSDEAFEYYANEAEKDYSELLKKYGGKAAIPKEELNRIKEKSSIVDEELLSFVSGQFASAIA